MLLTSMVSAWFRAQICWLVRVFGFLWNGLLLMDTEHKGKCFIDLEGLQLSLLPSCWSLIYEIHHGHLIGGGNIYIMKEEPLICALVHKALDAFFTSKYTSLRAIPVTQVLRKRMNCSCSEMNCKHGGERKDEIIDCLWAWSLNVYMT